MPSKEMICHSLKIYVVTASWSRSSVAGGCMHYLAVRACVWTLESAGEIRAGFKANS